MRILENIPKMDMQALARLEENCHRTIERGDESKIADARKVLGAIRVERDRRSEQEQSQRAEVRKGIQEEMRNKSLFERVLRAFEEFPPTESELKWLRALAENPGANSEKIAKEAGSKSAGVTNLKIGSICANREHYLGVAPPLRRHGKKYYSELLVDFDRHTDKTGRVWHSWRLKLEAEAALRHLGFLNRK